jgi:hypothetical protein
MRLAPNLDHSPQASLVATARPCRRAKPRLVPGISVPLRAVAVCWLHSPSRSAHGFDDGKFHHVHHRPLQRDAMATRARCILLCCVPSSNQSITTKYTYSTRRAHARAPGPALQHHACRPTVNLLPGRRLKACMRQTLSHGLRRL